MDTFAGELIRQHPNIFSVWIISTLRSMVMHMPLVSPLHLPNRLGLCLSQERDLPNCLAHLQVQGHNVVI